MGLEDIIESSSFMPSTILKVFGDITRFVPKHVALYAVKQARKEDHEKACKAFCLLRCLDSSTCNIRDKCKAFKRFNELIE